jgi:hypothetical protein
MEHFNKLSPSQHEILTKIFEEGAEVIKDIAKIMLHGLASHEPGHPHPYPDNRTKLVQELGDFAAMVHIAVSLGLFTNEELEAAVKRRLKRSREENYFHHIDLS